MSAATNEGGAERAEPIAIIGMGCRFPGGAHSPEEFWRMLREGVDAIVEVPADRWNADAYYDPDRTRPGRAATRWGGFVRQPVEEFDAAFFRMSPREAAHLDPMQRWLMEVSWDALEDAGQDAARLAGTAVGVYVGVFTEDTKLFQLGAANRHLIGSHTGTGTAMTMASNRLSYWFDFRGPSVSVDTACSSSLVAVHLACQSLWSGESTLALAGGANAMFMPDFTIAESRAGMLSPDGRCKSFDAAANGYVRGEGAGIVVLKPLSRALADGDPVRAVILATASNQDGRTSGITVPSGDAQVELVREAFRRAGMQPGRMHYMEAHGTGTPVGDPIEVNALGRALADGRPDGERCVVGSVKANIGHLEAAAGVAGLIKAALCLEQRQIPPQLHFQNANPAIPFEELCLRVPTELEEWPAEEGPALAAVNSFGFGGSNAHAVLSAAPEPAPRGEEEARPELVVVSGHTAEALAERAEAWREWAEAGRIPSLADLAYTAGARRGHHEHRLALVAHSTEELAEQLAAFAAGEERPGMTAARLETGRRRLAWVFSGMGPQWWGMGRELLRDEPVFRAAVEEVDALFHALSGWSLIAEMTRPEAESRMAETRVSQPANFALQVGLAALLRSRGVEPAAIVGHSTGEVAAIHAAGALPLDEAVRVIYHRSRLQHLTTGQGTLMAVGLPLDGVRERVAALEGVSVAAVNGPATVTLAGEPEALRGLAAELEAEEVFCRFLKVDVPFHSHYMDPIRAELEASLAGLRLRPATTPLYSTVTGGRVGGTELDAGYWWRNVREPVYFAAAVDALADDGYDLFLEVGPHPVVSASVGECLAARGRPGIAIPTLRRKTDERAAVLGALGALYARGLGPEWEAMRAPGARVTALPTYPWQRQRHWDESAESRLERLGGDVHPLLGRRMATAAPAWQTRLRSRDTAFMADHVIGGSVIYPGAAYVELGLAAARQHLPGAPAVELEDVEFERALFMSDDTATAVQTVLDPETLAFTVYGRGGEEGGWTRCARGRVSPSAPRPGHAALAALQERMGTPASRDDAYRRLHELGYHFGPTFRNLRDVWTGGGECLAYVAAHERVEAEAGRHHLHPSVLDACFQALLVAGLDGMAATYLPVRLGRVAVHGEHVGTELWVHARVTRLDEAALEGSLEAYDPAGNLRLSIEGIRTVSMDAQEASGQALLPHLFHDLVWREAGEAGDELPASGSWLILADRGGVGDALAAALEARGGTPVRVYAGDVDPGSREELERVLVPGCRGVVHLWSLDAPAGEETTARALMDAQTLGPVSLLHLVQALGGAAEPPRLWVATRGVTSADERGAAVAQSAVWGLARTVFHQEYVELAGGVVDLDPARPHDEAERLVELFTRAPAGEDQFALREGRTLVPRLEPAADLAAEQPAPRFRADGTYLVTGGLGGLGLIFARWLVERGARRLLLMGRSVLPERSTWATLAPGSREARSVAAVRELEALGASVHLAAVDVADEEALTAFVAGFRAQGWPPIRGVLHAAGVAAPQLVDQETAAGMRDGITAKVAGGWNLHRVLAGEPLDLFVLFSSVTSLGFSLGLGTYAAGNAFLDALALHRQALGLPAVSVNWGAWGEAGMSTRGDTARDFESRGFLILPPAAGLTAQERILASGRAQVVATPMDWVRLDRVNYPAGAPAMLRGMVEAAAAAAGDAGTTNGAGRQEGILDRLAAAEEGDRRALLEDFLRDLAARVFRFDPARLEPGQPLNALGLDSIMAVELKSRIETGLGASPSIVELLRGASVASLATLLLPRLVLRRETEEDAELAELALALEQLGGSELEALLGSGA